VADADAVDRAAARVEEELGPIDVWVNNAMVSVFSPVREMTAADYRQVTEVTYLGYVHGTLAALRRMLPRDCGTIVQVGSALCYRGIPLQSAYCAAKHAIQGFTESLRCELIHDGSNVKVTMVHLPATNTPQFDWSKSRMPRKAQPVPPIYQPEVAARAVHHAAHHYRREWTVGLITDVVLAGNAVIPGLGDWYLGRAGYESQLTAEPEEPGRPDDLYDPLPGDRGAHGRFDRRACAASQQWWVTKNRGWLAAAGLVIAGLVLLRPPGRDRGQ
jgi:NAD(P)-dependent dehydrogenase (short-subunit alcohol dehydrogenase family)